MIAWAHEADSGCEAMPSHVRFSVRHASHMRTESPWRAIGRSLGRTRWIQGARRCPQTPTSFHAGCLGNLSVESPGRAIGRSLGRTRWIQGARRCPQTPTSFHAGCLGNLSVESPGLAIGSSLGRTRWIQGARRCHRTCSRHGISLACHRMIAWAHEADLGCEAMPSHVRFSARHASHVQPAWNLLGVPSDDCRGARGGFRVRGDAIARAI
jgi:hypothetical protein